MQLYQIINLNCKEKANRIALVKEVMKAIKASQKPDIKFLKKWSASVGKKYNMPLRIFEIANKYSISIQHEEGYIMFLTSSEYEAYCKHILIVKSYVKE